MRKRKKIVLGVLCVVLLLAVCFVCVGLYAKNELSKPKFTMPEQPALSSVTELPTDASQGEAYIRRLYDAAVAADDVEGSWKTEVELNGEYQTPFAPADQTLFEYFCKQSAGRIGALYPDVSNVRMNDSQEIPPLPTSAAVLDMEASQGEKTEDHDESGFYFITLHLDPAAADTQAMLESDVCREIGKTLAPAASVDSAEIEVREWTLCAKIDRVTDQLVSVDVTRDCTIRATCTLTDDYAALSPEKTVDVSIPYRTHEIVRFSYYGVRFLQQAMAVKPGDMKALPASVTVNENATSDEYTVTYDVSQPETMTIDADGVMTVEKACDDPVTITMTLDYDGHTYSDSLTVYITELEVESDA